MSLVKSFLRSYAGVVFDSALLLALWCSNLLSYWCISVLTLSSPGGNSQMAAKLGLMEYQIDMFLCELFRVSILNTCDSG